MGGRASLEEVACTACGFDAGFFSFGQLVDVAIHGVLGVGTSISIEHGKMRKRVTPPLWAPMRQRLEWRGRTHENDGNLGRHDDWMSCRCV